MWPHVCFAQWCYLISGFIDHTVELTDPHATRRLNPWRQAENYDRLHYWCPCSRRGCQSHRSESKYDIHLLRHYASKKTFLLVFLYVSLRWQQVRPSRGCPSYVIAGMTKPDTVTLTSVMPSSSLAMNTWVTLTDWSSLHSLTGTYVCYTSTHRLYIVIALLKMCTLKREVAGDPSLDRL